MLVKLDDRLYETVANKPIERAAEEGGRVFVLISRTDNHELSHQYAWLDELRTVDGEAVTEEMVTS